MLPARIRNKLNSVQTAYISGIYSYFVNSRLRCGKSQFIIKMYIGNKRYSYLFLYSRYKLNSVHIRYSCADYIAACLLKLLSLFNTSLDIVRPSVEH